ncbi:MAG TPA: hypothetical protein VGB97_02220 [Candidatus Paceibacterota bacterium]|jgi:hypothetical protein
MRAFSIIELLIACAVGMTGIIAASLLVLGAPLMLENARLERHAYAVADTLLDRAKTRANKDFTSLANTSTTTEDGFEQELSLVPLHAPLAAFVEAYVGWTDARGEHRRVQVASLITNPDAARFESCSPILFGTWSALRKAASFPLGAGSYAISGIAISRDLLVTSLSTTLGPGDATLSFYSLGNFPEHPQLLRAHDNAPTSRTGYAAVVAGQGYIYAANAFGSASPATCMSYACSQVHILSPQGELVGSLALGTTTGARAISAGSLTTPGKSLLYAEEILYVGLEKTVDGMEFNIIDVRNPSSPAWLGGVRVGRSVHGIAVSNGHAYLATSDPLRELIIVDIREPSRPRIVGTWDAPGSQNFGLGNRIFVRDGQVYLGRTYVNNAPEFWVLDTTNLQAPTPLASVDLGKSLQPESVNGLIVRQGLVLVLSGKRLLTLAPINESYVEQAVPVNLAGTGTALSCRGNTLFIGSTDEGGRGFIEAYEST